MKSREFAAAAPELGSALTVAVRGPLPSSAHSSLLRPARKDDLPYPTLLNGPHWMAGIWLVRLK